MDKQKDDISRILDVNEARKIFEKASLSGIVLLLDYLVSELGKETATTKI